jgi:3,4-dihydroxyphenylacetate 2,3-dioxygenase
MGTIVAAALLGHVPPLVMPPEMRLMLGGGRDTSLIAGLADARARLDACRADTLVIFDTHWMTTTEHIVAGAEHHKGLYTSDELPLLMADVPYDYPGAAALARGIEAVVAERGQPVGAVGSPGSPGLRVINSTNPNLPKHYPTLNLLRYLHRGERVLSCGTCQTAEPHNFLEFGAAIAAAVERTEGRVALIASGGMSHRFWPLDHVFEHGSYAPEHVRTPAARAIDEHILELWAQGRHDAVIELQPAYREHGPEGRFGHYLTMAGAMGGAAWRGHGHKLSAYENAIGTGQVHVWFE